MEAAKTKFQVREPIPGCVVLICRGGLSWEDRELLVGHVERVIAQRADVRGIAIDMSAVEFVNSAGLGALFQLTQRLRGRSMQLLLGGVPVMLQRLFQSVGLDRIARICRDVDEAVDLLGAAGPQNAGAESTRTRIGVVDSPAPIPID